MILTTFYLACFFAALIVEVALVHSLPMPFSMLSFVLVLTVYSYQYVGRPKTLWWLVAFGFFIDIFDLSGIEFQTIAYFLSALVLAFVSRTIFTNSSFYGLAGTVVVSLFSLHLALFVLATFQQISGSVSVTASVYGAEFLWSICMTLVFLLLFFPFARRLKFYLDQLLPQS